MSIITDNPNLLFLNLEQAGRAMLLAFFCDIPLVFWGGTGIGKTSKVRQITLKLKCPTDSMTQKKGDPYKLYDLRLSDKERSDLGGVPVPIGIEMPHDIKGESPAQTKARVRPYVEYLMARSILPVDTDEYCVLFIDEVDRTDDPGVKNAIQQWILDRACNGHYLSVNCRIVLAGNGTSDIDTSEMSKAANGRMIHIYIENETIGALESWQEWAAESVAIDVNDPDAGVQTRASDMLRAFAQANHQIWINHQVKQGEVPKPTIYMENAEVSNRTWIYADSIIRATDRVGFKTADILKPLVAGCVGLGAAIELLEYRKVFDHTPTIQAILADPEKVMVPDRPDILYMLTFSLTDQATRDRATAEAVATYGNRWPEEPAAFLFRRLLDKQPSVATTPPFLKWSGKRLKHTPTTGHPAYTNHLPELSTIFTGGTPRVENDQWINRIEIPSRSNPSGKGHILAQNRKDLYWACSCPGWINRRTCDHSKRVPSHMFVADPPAKDLK